MPPTPDDRLARVAAGLDAALARVEHRCEVCGAPCEADHAEVLETPSNGAPMGDRTDYFRQYKRDQRKEARKAGLCIICCTQQPRKGNVTCDPCQKRANEAKRS